MHIVYIEFGVSKSQKYKKACVLANQFPNQSIINGTIRCYIDTVLDYIKIQHVVFQLISIVHKWKKSKITFYGDLYLRAVDYSAFLNKLKKDAGKYSRLVHDRHPSDVAFGSIISYEDLPLPIVYYPASYGAFFAFSSDINEKICFCECQKAAIEKSIKMRMEHPLINCSGSRTYPLSSDFFPEIVAEISARSRDNPLKHFEFKEGICFRCNNKIPQLKYCDPMYGGTFKQHYGWNINQESISLNIDPHYMTTLLLNTDECTPEFVEYLRRAITLFKTKSTTYIESTNDLIALQKELSNILENIVREELGYPRIGESWVSETLLFKIVQSLYPNERIIRHYRPKWLEGLELDIYIPEQKLAIEYQGVQHFKAINHWGGEEQLNKQQEHDHRKKRICIENGILLICINYDEELSNDYIRKRIVTASEPPNAPKR